MACGSAKGGGISAPSLDSASNEVRPMIRIGLMSFAISFAVVMAYAFYLQARIWHLL